MPAIQTQTNHGDVHQPAPNCSLAASRPIIEIAPAGAGIPTKNSARVGGLGAVVEQRVEPGQPQHDAHRVEQHHHPAGRRRRQQRHVDDHRGRDPEVHRVGQRIDLCAHPRLGVQDAGHPAVEAVEDRRRGDQRQRDVRLVLEGELIEVSPAQMASTVIALGRICRLHRAPAARAG